MATNYPGAVDSLTNPAAGDALNSPSHAAQHANANDAIEAVQTELGANPSGGDATVAARLTAIETGARLGTNSVGATQLADSAVDTAAIADGAVTAAKLAVQPGNLLTENQASVETDTTGFVVTNNTGSTAIARVTSDYYHGTASLRLTCGEAGLSQATGTPRPGLGTPMAVTVGETYTAHARVKSASRSMRLRILWWTAAGANLGDTGGSGVACTSWTQFMATGVAPATAAYASVEIDTTTSGSGTDTAFIDALGLWRGAGGGWAMPGVPITNQGRRVTHPNIDDVLVQTWDDTAGRWQVTHYDSGWRDVSALLVNGWTAASGKVHMRRVGGQVQFQAERLNGSGASSSTIISAWPASFQAPSGYVCTQAVRPSVWGDDLVWAELYGSGLTIGGTYSGYDARFYLSFPCSAAIPTSLPGTLVSAAPYA